MNASTRNFLWVVFVVFLVVIALVASIVPNKKGNTPYPTSTTNSGTSTLISLALPTSTVTTGTPIVTPTLTPTLTTTLFSTEQDMSQSNARLVCALYGGSLADINSIQAISLNKSDSFWISSFNGNDYNSSCLVLFNETVAIGENCKEKHSLLCETHP